MHRSKSNIPLNAVLSIACVLSVASVCSRGQTIGALSKTPSNGGSELGRTISSDNIPPVLNTPRPQTDEDVPLTFQLIADDPNPGDVVRFQITQLPFSGSLYQVGRNGVPRLDRPIALWDFVTNPGGWIHYVPSEDFQGTDAIRVQAYDLSGPGPWAPMIAIDVFSVPDAPVASDIAYEWPNTGGTIIHNVNIYPTDVDTLLSQIQICITSLSSEGMLMVTRTGEVISQAPFCTFDKEFRFIYAHPEAIGRGCASPDANLPETFPFEAASFTYRAFDGESYSDEKAVRLSYYYVNTAPHMTSETAYTTNEDTPVDFTLSGADIDGDTFLFRVTSAPQHGMLLHDGVPLGQGLLLVNGTTLTYVPDPDFNTLGAAAEEVHVEVFDQAAGARDCDYVLGIHVTAVNDAPVIHGPPNGIGATAGSSVNFVNGLWVTDDAAEGTVLEMELRATGPAAAGVYLPFPSSELVSFVQVSPMEVRMVGTLDALNASCMSGVTYFVANNGATTAFLEVEVNDQGNTSEGTPTPLTTLLVIPVEVYTECEECG